MPHGWVQKSRTPQTRMCLRWGTKFQVSRKIIVHTHSFLRAEGILFKKSPSETVTMSGNIGKVWNEQTFPFYPTQAFGGKMNKNKYPSLFSPQHTNHTETKKQWSLVFCRPNPDPKPCGLNPICWTLNPGPYVYIYIYVYIPPKKGVIALWRNTRVVKCKYYVFQKPFGFNNKIHSYSILLTFIFDFTARL